MQEMFFYAPKGGDRGLPQGGKRGILYGKSEKKTIETA